MSASARRLLALAAREDDGHAAEAHRKLFATQAAREPSWLSGSPSLETRRRCFSLYAAYGLSRAVTRLASGDRDGAASISAHALGAADRGFDIRLSVACIWVGSVAKSAVVPRIPVVPLAC